MKTTRSLALLLALTLPALLLLALPTPTARANPGILRVKTSGTTTWPCGQTDWSNPCALQTALTRSAAGDELWVAAGTYTPTTGADRTISFELQPGVALYGGFAMTETSRSQRNFTANVTILSGDINAQGTSSDNSYHVVSGSGVTETAVLDGFTVTGGNANDSADPNDRGGGMYNYNGSPTLKNVTFSGNSAVSGGGMYNYFSGPTLTSVTFVSNTAVPLNGKGGGMYNDFYSSPTLTSTTFLSNTSSYSGGGMDNNNFSNPVLTNTTFFSNTANYGGGMLNENFSSPTLTNVTFSGNMAAEGGGMGIFNSNPTLTNVAFSSNLAYEGGGMYTRGGAPTLTDVTFSSNLGFYGGGVYQRSSDVEFTNVTFSSNFGRFTGGGMHSEDSSSLLTNVTCSGNSAELGGGMYSYYDGSLTLKNVTLSGNIGNAAGGAMYNWGSNPTVRNAILWGNTAPNGWQVYHRTGGSGLYDTVVQGGCPDGSTCTSIISADPHLAALGNWGGSTQTVPLLPGSSAINAGDDATCAATDQRGILRPQGTHCDIGAFESRGFTLTKSGGDDQGTPPNMLFPIPLRVTVSSAYGEPVNGGVVTFTAPSSGPSATPVTSTMTIASGQVSRPMMANAIPGWYYVTADTAGATAPVLFVLTNALAIPTQVDTTTVITSSENPVLVSHPVTFTVTVSAAASITPTGTVDFYELTSPSPALRGMRRALASHPLVDSVATFTVPSLTRGAHTFLALYSGDATCRASTSALYTQNAFLLDYYLPLMRR